MDSQTRSSRFFSSTCTIDAKGEQGGRPVQSWGWRDGSENVTSEINIGIKDQLSHWSFRHFIFLLDQLKEKQ